MVPYDSAAASVRPEEGVSRRFFTGSDGPDVADDESRPASGVEVIEL
jgi:hypothetical protein